MSKASAPASSDAGRAFVYIMREERPYSKHGFNIHGVVFDELHTQQTESSLTS